MTSKETQRKTRNNQGKRGKATTKKNKEKQRSTMNNQENKEKKGNINSKDK